MRIEERWCGRVAVMEKQDWNKHYHAKKEEWFDSIRRTNLDEYVPKHVKHIVFNVESERLTDDRLNTLMAFIRKNTDSWGEAYDVTYSIICEHNYERGAFEELFLRHLDKIRNEK